VEMESGDPAWHSAKFRGFEEPETT